MKDLTIGGYIMHELDKLLEQIDVYRGEIKKLNDEINREKTKKFTDKVTLNTKFYRFRHYMDDDILHYGVITSFWYSQDDEMFIMNYCGFSSEFLDFADANWFSYDAMTQWSIPERYLDKLIDSFEECDEKTFWKIYEGERAKMDENFKSWVKNYKYKK